MWIFVFIALIGLLVEPLINLSQYWSHNPLYGYGWFVPIMVAILAYQRIEKLPHPDPSRRKWLGRCIVLILIFWIPLRVVQVANPDWRVLDTLFMGSGMLAVLLLLARMFGTGWAKAMFFPLLLLATALPWPIQLERIVTLQSLQSVGEAAKVILGLFGMQVEVVGFEIRTPYGVSHLSDACSGIRSFHLAVVGGLFLGGFLPMSFVRRGWLLLACLATGFVINVVRVCLLVTILFQSQSVLVMNEWHDQLGWITQAVFLVLMLVEAVLFFAIKRPHDLLTLGAQPTYTANLADVALAARKHVSLLLTIIMFCIWVPLMAEGWYLLHERERGISDKATGWSLVEELPHESVREMPMPQIVQEQLPYEDGRYLVWYDASGAVWQLYWMRFDGSTYSAFAHNIHQPETCLPSQNYTFVEAYKPVGREIDGEEYVWRHQYYEREGAPLHLFFNKTANGLSHVDGSSQDWSALGRLKQAWEGIRIRNAQVLHISAFSSASTEEVRHMAGQYLEQFVESDEISNDALPFKH